MVGSSRHRPIARLALAASLATLLAAALASSPAAPTAVGLSRWTGGVDLYRPGVFTTQKTWLWCTAADVQIIRNIVDHQTDHSTTSQRIYFDYMRAHDRYRIPLKDGTDPAGWTAGLRHYVDARYSLVASRSFDSALRSAVTNLRKTNLPVAITVMHGNHGWVLTGFTATADPATTNRFTVTSVRVVGPLWGLQNRSYGYDMRPDTRLTPSQLKGFFTPWHYTSVPMAWENRWVSIQPIPKSVTPPATAASKAPAPLVAAASAKPSPSPAASSSVPAATKSQPTEATPASVARGGSPEDMDIVAAQHAAAMRNAAESTAPVADPSPFLPLVLIAGLAAAAGLGLFAARRRRPG